jgi:hypothetical protein
MNDSRSFSELTHAPGLAQADVWPFDFLVPGSLVERCRH